MPLAAHAADLVRLGDLKFAHYDAVAYMKEIAPKYNLKIEERVFSKGLDFVPAIIAGEIDVGQRFGGGHFRPHQRGCRCIWSAGFAKGGVRIVGRVDLNLSRIADLTG